MFRHIDTTHSSSKTTEMFAVNLCQFLVFECFNFENVKLHHLLLSNFLFSPVNLQMYDRGGKKQTWKTSAITVSFSEC